MLLHNTITGVIAAVMVALGAGQIGNTNTQVEEELVVEGEGLTTLQTDWYIFNETGDYDDPQSYHRLDGDLEGLCPEGLSELCAIHVAVGSGNGTHPDEPGLQALQTAIQNAVQNGYFDDTVIRMKP